MSNISIADYVKLKNIYEYLDIRRDECISKNNGFSSYEADKVTDLMKDMESIFNKLEKE